MPYLGSTPNASFSTRTKQDFTANGSTTAFTLSSAVASANDIEVFVGNVRQEPTDAYTVNGTTLTMSAAPTNGINFYVVFKGVEENSVVPADGTISSAKIANGVLTPTAISSQANAATDFFGLPSGTTAQRPNSPANGYIRYNTTTGLNEVYQNGGWEVITSNFSATGGTVVTSGSYKYHTFTSSANFVVSSGTKSVEYLIVAGGGGGGNHAGGGGGGAGGFLTGTTTATANTYSIVVGAGGAKVGTASSDVTNDGNDSSGLGYTAIGGGRSSYQTGGDDGGSGGGGMGNGGQSSGGSGTAGQGNAGGIAGATSMGGGGGGAGAAGAASSSGQGGAGGVGLNTLSAWATATSSGASGYYAGGGGGGTHNSPGTGGAGGSGGGAAGASYGTSDGGDGSTNTGGGGGGAGGRNGINATSGGAGGSGIVIIRYEV
jgi:hypothetical protein